MQPKQIIGDYEEFYDSVSKQLSELGIDIRKYELSHLGYKTATLDSYKKIRNELLPLCSEYIENMHNGRLILKAYLKYPIILSGKPLHLIELMPPKLGKAYDDALEHIGIVLGKELQEFEETYHATISEIQDQGPYCKPATMLLKNNKRVKFYEYSLKEAIELEGGKFIPMEL